MTARGHVSRETVPPAPAALADLFPADTSSIHRYVDIVTSTGVDKGLIGPREVPRIWDRHILNCAVLAPLVPREATVADIGSGAGLPGLVVAIARPDVAMTLVEPLLRRAVFLAETVEALGLRNVEVLRSRAEGLVGRRVFDRVTARAVAPLTRLVPWTLPLCRAGGEVLALKGSSAAVDVAEAADTLRAWRAGDVAVEDVAAHGTVVATVVRIQSSGYLGGRPAPRRKGSG